MTSQNSETLTCWYDIHFTLAEFEQRSEKTSEPVLSGSSRQKIEILFSEESKLKYTNGGVQNKQTEMPHQVTLSKTHG